MRSALNTAARTFVGRRSVFAALFGATTLFVGGCAFLVEIDGLTGGEANDSPASADGGLDARVTTDGSEVHIDGAKDNLVPPSPPPLEDGGCVNRGGPDPVRIKTANVTFCVDSTEVTRAHYAAFLASNPKLTDLPSVCAWKTGFVPTNPWPPAADEQNLPASNVDWCDAIAFCSWSGKHLCGKIGGGEVGDPRDTNVSEWLFACSNGGAKIYPYGNTWDPAACNGTDLAANRILKVASLPKCVGGVQGVYDMSGNGHELMNSCTAAPDGGPVNEDNCAMHLGAYDGHGENDLKCASIGTWRRDRRHPAVSFRCCGN